MTTWNTQSKNTSTFTNTNKSSDRMSCYLKLDESSGDAIDYVNGEVFADTYSNVARSTGKINNGAVFADGTTTQLVSNNSINLGIISGYSVSFWIYPTASLGVRYLIANQPINTNFALLIQSLRFRFITHTSIGTDTTSAQIGSTPINTWTHVVCTYDINVGVNIYINGVLNASNVFVSTPNYTPKVISIGKITLGSTSSFTGSLDEIGFWNYALSQSEIDELYNSGTGKQPPFTFPANPFTNLTKNISTFSNLSKNVSTMVNQSKNSSSWSNISKS